MSADAASGVNDGSFDVAEAVDILSRTSRALRALLADLPEPWACASEGEGTWSPFDVLGHLVHGERTDWIVRARMIVEHRDAKSFESFDRRGHEKWWDGWSMNEMLDEFERLREGNLAVLASFELTEAKLDLPGDHPELGPVTMRQLLSSWVVHDLHHVGQITRVMAKRYAGEVGPWGEYLSVLKR